jgi:hypothetical protein
MPSLGVSSLDFDRVGNDAVFFSPRIFGQVSDPNFGCMSARRSGAHFLLGSQRPVQEIVEEVVVRH